MCVTNISLFLNNSFNLSFSGQADESFHETQLFVYEKDPTPFDTRPAQNETNVESALFQVQISAEITGHRIFDLVVPVKMSCCQILPCALKALLNSHPSGSKDQESMEHMLLCTHGFVKNSSSGHSLFHAAAAATLASLVLPLNKPKHPYFCKNLPKHCPLHAPCTGLVQRKQQLMLQEYDSRMIYRLGMCVHTWPIRRKKIGPLERSIFIVNVKYEKNYMAPHIKHTS